MAGAVESDIQNALILLYPKTNDGTKVKPLITTKRFDVKELEEAENPSQFVENFASNHGLQEYARAEGITGELELKLFGRSFERTKEFPEGRHSFVGPPGYKKDLETLHHDIKAGTHEVLIKIYEKRTRMFMEVKRQKEVQISPKRKDVSPDAGEKKKQRTEALSPEPVKNMVKRSKAVREEESELLRKLKEKQEIKRNPREEAEFEAFKSEVENVTFDSKWSKSGLPANAEGLVCAKALSEIDVKCPACGAVLRMNKMRISFNLKDHLQKKCSVAKAKKFNQQCKPFDFSKCRQKLPLDVGEEDKSEQNVDDPDVVVIDPPTSPEVETTAVGGSDIGFSGESAFGSEFGFQSE